MAMLIAFLLYKLSNVSILTTALVVLGIIAAEFFLLPPRVVTPSALRRQNLLIAIAAVVTLIASMAFFAQPLLFGRIIFP